MTNEEMFNKNINIAYKIANQYLSNYPNEYEDIKQVALLSLWQSVERFDNSKGFAFSTFAYKVIFNNINCYLRKPKQIYANTISLDTPIDENLTIKDIIKDNFDIFDKLEYEEINQIKNNILNNLSDRDKQIYKKLLDGKTQYEIATEFNLSQAQICRIWQKINNKIKQNYLKGGLNNE